MIAGLVAADHGDSAAVDTLDHTLAALDNHRDWRELVAVLRRIRAGARDPALATGLDPIDTAIVHRALAALAGTAQVDTDAWHTLTTEQLTDLVTTTVAAAGGDPDATNTLTPLLEQLAAHPDWAPPRGHPAAHHRRRTRPHPPPRARPHLHHPHHHDPGPAQPAW